MSDIVATFCNFEYLHQAIMRQRYGKSGLKKNMGRLQPTAVDVDAVMDYARSFGQVLHAEAFGHWQHMGRYSNKLKYEDVNLIQVFPENSRDVADTFPQMSTRIKQLLDYNEDINTVVLVGADDDYVGVVEEVKALGCQVYCIGALNLKDSALKTIADKYVDYYEIPGTGDAPTTVKATVAPRSGDKVKFYLRVAAQQGVRMPPPHVMWIGIDIYSSFLNGGGEFASFKDLDDECYRQLIEDVPDTTMTEVKKIRQVLFKCYLFRPSDDGRISFQENIKSLEDIEDCYFSLMLNRISGNLAEATDYESLSRALTGDDKSADRLLKLHEEIQQESTD